MSESHYSLNGKRIILGVTGSIAAYKAVSLLRTLVQAGADVSVVMTQSATRFIAPLTFEVLSKHPVAIDLFSGKQEMMHITWPEHADLIVLAPCTANRMAKYALGLADDLLSTMLMTTQCPVVIAPAMDGEMWDQPALKNHVAVLRERGVTILEPEIGPLASGKWSQGRLPSEEAIVATIEEKLRETQDWVGHHFLISAGPTREPIDAVRFLSNGSSGKMGYELAEAAVARGARVTLVSGPTELAPPPGIEFLSVTTAEEMHQALASKFERATVLIMAAAVGDFRPRQVNPEKFKKQDWNGEPLELERTTDILAALSAQRTHQILVGFAAETSNLLENGQAKLKKKSLDMIVVNQIGGTHSAFGNETNEVILIPRGKTPQPIPRLPKRAVADRILTELHTFTVPASSHQPVSQI
ncbi:MAG: bifunctional phosphopantothenoylcysteine decarboxylase/phosphopantothenate--cysteine ligase CoaBC [Nitrospirota bacterium]|nr:MAG: bifunctional phosphopantothenoylcysteine decarboxylase/phosphopantothenate--cysteine ligase CoaBC [Nitrospirota bacterium]